MPTLREALADAVDALVPTATRSDPGLSTVLPLLFELVARARGLTTPSAWVSGPTPGADAAREALAVWTEPGAAEQLGEVYQGVLVERRGSGSFYTPAALVDWLLDRALDPTLADCAPRLPTVLDPTCGTGHVLVPAAHRLADRLDRPLADVLGVLHGMDLDPWAVEITRFLVWLGDPATPYDDLAGRIRVGNAMLLDWSEQAPTIDAGFDVVVGNPPFLNQLRRGSVRGAEEVAALRGAGHRGAYTDTSAVILSRALGQTRPGGRVALVQPVSVLAARDAAPLRAAVAGAGAITDFWSTDVSVFPDAAVLTCVPVIRLAGVQSAVRTWHGPALDAGVAVEAGDLSGEWGHLAAPGLGIPVVGVAHASGVLADLGRVTADFRDQYYGLVPHVREAVDGLTGPDEAPLVTTGLIDPAHCGWGVAETRFARRRFAAPVVDLAGVRADGDLADWAERRLVPKVLVATQGRVIEAVVDEVGAWVPSVPTISLIAPPRLLWHVLAVLLAPPVSALAASRYAGAGLSPTAIKLSATQVGSLPLPVDRSAWDRGAAIARDAQHATDDEGRRTHLRALGRVMSAAYGEEGALDWWLARARLVSQVEESTSSGAGDRGL